MSAPEPFGLQPAPRLPEVSTPQPKTRKPRETVSMGSESSAPLNAGKPRRAGLIHRLLHHDGPVSEDSSAGSRPSLFHRLMGGRP